jgi:hypothetical protein
MERLLLAPICLLHSRVWQAKWIHALISLAFILMARHIRAARVGKYYAKRRAGVKKSWRRHLNWRGINKKAVLQCAYYPRHQPPSGTKHLCNFCGSLLVLPKFQIQFHLRNLSTCVKAISLILDEFAVFANFGCAHMSWIIYHCLISSGSIWEKGLIARAGTHTYCGIL